MTRGATATSTDNLVRALRLHSEHICDMNESLMNLAADRLEALAKVEKAARDLVGPFSCDMNDGHFHDSWECDAEVEHEARATESLRVALAEKERGGEK